MRSQRTFSRFAFLVVAPIVVLGGLWLFARTPLSLGNATSVEDHGVFYRLLAKYQYRDEIVDFDIVVGCNVRVTRYGDGDKSYDAFRDPVVYAKAIGGGHALMQMVPSACHGETTDNGEVPSDFLPGVIWFELAGDFSLGVAYVTEDAFERADSALRFLAASIHPATREEWLAFEPTAAKNLFNPRPLFAYAPLVDPAEIRRNLGNARRLYELWPVMGCHLVTRIHLTNPADRAAIRQYWPSEKPRYWAPPPKIMRALVQQLSLFVSVEADGHPFNEYLRLNYETSHGFPTRGGGGVIGSKHKRGDKLPATIFPIRRDEGIPWASPDALTAQTLYRHVELGDATRGLAYCFGEVSGNQLHLPAYETGSFTTLVSGSPIIGEDINMTTTPLSARPRPFFENDEYFYFQDDFSIN